MPIRPRVQVSDGRVKSVSAASAGDLVSDGWTLLDVRPPHEVQKVKALILCTLSEPSSVHGAPEARDYCGANSLIGCSFWEVLLAWDFMLCPPAECGEHSIFAFHGNLSTGSDTSVGLLTRSVAAIVSSHCFIALSHCTSRPHCTKQSNAWS